MKDAGKEKPGVLIYFDVRDPLEELDVAERGELFTAILNYGADGIEPTFENKLLRMAWAIVKRGLDRDDANYRTTMRKRKYAIYCRYEKEAGRTPLTFDEWDAQANESEDSCIHVYTHEDTCIPTTTTTTTTTPTTTTTTTPTNIESAQPAEPAPSPKAKKFVKPTLEEVTEYVRQGGYPVDPERFHAYYESCGWTVKGRSMKDWKAAVRYWATSGTDRNRTGTRPEPQPAQPQRKGSYFVPHGRALSYAEYEAMARPAEDDDDDDAAFEAMLKGGTT